MMCQSKARRQVRNAAGDLDLCPEVEAVDEIPASDHPTGKWAVEIWLNTRGVTDVVNGVFSEYGLWTWTAQPQGEFWQAVAVVGK